MGRSAKQIPAGEERLRRLAKRIEALAEKDESALARARHIADLRRSAASDLHAACAGFVAAVNALLPSRELTLDPETFETEAFREDSPNLIQINLRGRILQVEFRTTPDSISTEEFRVPYTLEGTIRAFNQQLLDKHLIEEQLLFYTLEKDRNLWRFFDARTYRTGAFDRDYLITLMEHIV